MVLQRLLARMGRAIRWSKGAQRRRRTCLAEAAKQRTRTCLVEDAKQRTRTGLAEVAKQRTRICLAEAAKQRRRTILIARRSRRAHRPAPRRSRHARGYRRAQRVRLRSAI